MSNYIYIANVIAAYWVVSISMVYLNKIILSTPGSSIPAPLFVTWYQCVVTCLICILLGHVGESTRSKGQKSYFNEYPLVYYRVGTGLAVLPLSLVFVGMISFNNLCLQYVEVSFYNVARCLSLVFNVIFTYLILGQSTHWKTCATLLIVILGFIMGINGELNFSLFGTSAGVLSSVFVSLNSIFTSKMLTAVDNDKSMLLYYNNFNAAVLFLPLILLFEGHVLASSWSTLTSGYFWLCMTLTGVMGFLIGLVTVLQVKATSPLTHNISGTAKAAAQSLLAFYIWGNAATLQGVAGILVVIVGSGLYSWVQMSLSAAPAPAQPVKHHLATHQQPAAQVIRGDGPEDDQGVEVGVDQEAGRASPR